MRALSQKFNKENHQSRKQNVSLARTVLPVQRVGPAREEEEPLLLQRPERAEILEELEELGKGLFQNKELPRTALEGQKLEMNPDNQPGAPKEKRKEQMIDLQNILTTKSPSVKSLAVSTTVELVSRARVMGHAGGSKLVQEVPFLHKEENQ